MSSGLHGNSSSAYDLSLFERKDNKIIKMPQKKHNKKRRLESFVRIALVLVIASVTIAAFGITLSTRAQINEMEAQISTANKQLKEAQNQYDIMQVELETKTSWANVEEYATKKLGMQKAENYQVNYIFLNEGNKIETSPAKEEDKGFFASIIDGIGSLLS